MNCNQELGALYGLADPSKIQSVYSVGIICALFVNAALMARGLKPIRILLIYPCMALITLGITYFVQAPFMCLAAGFLLGFFAAGGVLQIVTARRQGMGCSKGFRLRQRKADTRYMALGTRRSALRPLSS